jgi:hypothetical protein
MPDANGVAIERYFGKIRSRGSSELSFAISVVKEALRESAFADIRLNRGQNANDVLLCAWLKHFWCAQVYLQSRKRSFEAASGVA